MQLKRTAKDTKRPLLRTGNPAAVLRELKQARDPLYNELADIKVVVGENGGKRVMGAIMKKLSELNCQDL